MFRPIAKFFKPIIVNLDNHKLKYRSIRPLSVSIKAIIILLLFILGYQTVKYGSNNISSYVSLAISVVAVLIVLDLNDKDRTLNHLGSFFIRVESIKIKGSKIVLQIKNIGSQNICLAKIEQLKINGNTIADYRIIHLLKVDESVKINITAEIDCISNVEYRIVLYPLDGKMFLLNFTQEMTLKNGKYFLKPNACKLNRDVYYRW